MNTSELLERSEVACQVAMEAGKMVAEARAALPKIAIEVKGSNDIVTQLDRASEDLIRSRLHKQFPTDDILGEEGGLRGHGGKGCWIIDPIDGTENYVRGLNDYAVSIAFEEQHGQPCVGAVYCPVVNELYSAVRGQGAFCNGSPIKVSERKSPSAAITALSPPFRHHNHADEFFALYKLIFSQTCDVRNTGSAALHMCYVAAGRVDGYFEKGIYSFDIAAGLIIASEAGGEWSSLFEDGHPYDTHEILVANPHLHGWYRSQAKAVRSG